MNEKPNGHATQQTEVAFLHQAALTPEAAAMEKPEVYKGDEIPKKAKGGKVYGLVLENGGGTTVAPVHGRSFTPDKGRKFWVRPLGRHFLTATIPAGSWLYVWPATSAQPVTVGMPIAPEPEILDHMTGDYPPSLLDGGLRENTQAPGFVFQQWMAWAAVAALAVIGTCVLAYMWMQKKGMV